MLCVDMHGCPVQSSDHYFGQDNPWIAQNPYFAHTMYTVIIIYRISIIVAKTPVKYKHKNKLTVLKAGRD